MIIRREQMEQLQVAMDARQVPEFARRLRQVYPLQTTGVPESALLDQIQADIKTATSLEITEDGDLWRFVGLRYLPAEILESEYLQSVIVLILTRLEWRAGKRFDFLERHVFARRAFPRPAGIRY